jgi:hypothetical protein
MVRFPALELESLLSSSITRNSVRTESRIPMDSYGVTVKPCIAVFSPVKR